MYEYKFATDVIHPAALTLALQDVLGVNGALGISTYGDNRPFSAWLASEDDKAAAIAVITSHDPVTLTISKNAINADGTDTAILIVRTYRPDAAPVTVLVNDTPVPVTLVSGVGTLEITSDDPATITIAVQNPENRTTDTFTVEAR